MVAQLLYKCLVAQMGAGMLLLQRNSKNEPWRRPDDDGGWRKRVVLTLNGHLQTPVLHFPVHLQGSNVPWTGVISVRSWAPLEVFRITFHLVLVTDHKSFFVSILFCFELTDVTVHIASSV